MPPRKQDPAVRHLSPAELADRLGVSLDTVYAWNRDGTAPPRIPVGRHVRYRLADVEAWEEKRLIRPAAS